MKHTDIKDLRNDQDKYLSKNVTVCGWVRTSRDSKNTAFMEINDGSSFEHLQIVVDKATTAGDIDKAMQLGSALKVQGCVVKNPDGKSVEINAAEITVLGECPSDYPLQKKRHGLDFLRTIPHLRVRTNTFSAMFRVRSVLSEAIHTFFKQRGFHYVHTPIITGSDCEGAGESFKVTSIGYSNKYKSEAEYNAADFFGTSAGLTVSGQLEGEVIAMALGKIYTFGPTFRAENSNTTRHAAEFWQIEPEVAFAELPDIIEIAEDMIKFIIGYVLENCTAELEFFDKHIENGLIDKLKNLLSSEFAKIEYTEAIEILKKSGKEFVYKVDWDEGVQTEHEKYLAEEVYKKPVFVYNYPKHLKAFYMKQNADGKTVAATDLLVPGIGEIIGCSEREADYEKLKKEVLDRKMNISDYENYLELRKFGSAPHSGFGLGFERMLMFITGMGNIRDTILFPRAKGELK